MAREIKTLSLQKVEPNQPWGFRIVGGTDEALILKVDKVSMCLVNNCKKIYLDIGMVLLVSIHSNIIRSKVSILDYKTLSRGLLGYFGMRINF